MPLCVYMYLSVYSWWLYSEVHDIVVNTFLTCFTQFTKVCSHSAQFEPMGVELPQDFGAGHHVSQPTDTSNYITVVLSPSDIVISLCRQTNPFTDVLLRSPVRKLCNEWCYQMVEPSATRTKPSVPHALSFISLYFHICIYLYALLEPLVRIHQPFHFGF